MQARILYRGIFFEQKCGFLGGLSFEATRRVVFLPKQRVQLFAGPPAKVGYRNLNCPTDLIPQSNHLLDITYTFTDLAQMLVF
jgi:hypothetical protein